MCGRINVSDHPGVQALLDDLGIPLFQSSLTPRYNIAPGAQLVTAFANERHLEVTVMEWGIVPAWAKEKAMRPLINARAETVWEKPSFRHLVKSKRAIIPANGFYEWKREGKTKTPYYIHPTDKAAFGFASIFQISKEGVMQCCVITTAANTAMSSIHDRMPVILSSEAMKDWLLSEDRGFLDSLMQPCPDDDIQLVQVSPYVSNARNEGEACIQPV